MVVVAPAGSFHHQRAAAGDPVFPLVAAAEAEQHALDADAAAAKAAAASGAAIQLWHQQPLTAAAAADGSPGKKPLAVLDYGRGGAGAVSGSGGVTCQDCGNQAKKGCAHNRCRTCCNSRGFECDTHVRSTWVPAARRRQSLQLLAAGAASPPPAGAGATATTKKPRLLACQTTTNTTNSRTRTSASNDTTPRSLDTSSHQDASFKDGLPRQVRESAVFRCVRVTSVDNGGEAEVAYQAAVTINGRLFRGLLYDQGAEADARATSSSAALPTTNSDLHLGSASAAVHDLYGGGSGPLILGGLGYGNTP